MRIFYTRLLSNRNEEITTKRATKRARVEKEQWNAGILEVGGKREMSTPLSRFTIVLDVEQPIHLFKKRARDGSATLPCEAPSRILPVGHAMQKVAEAQRLRLIWSAAASGIPRDAAFACACLRKVVPRTNDRVAFINELNELNEFQIA